MSGTREPVRYTLALAEDIRSRGVKALDVDYH
jgi:hypothetical protein